MRKKQMPDRIVAHSLSDIPQFASEEEEREWWATHDLAPELGEEVTEQERTLIQKLKAKHRYVSVQGEVRNAAHALLPT